MLAAQGYQESTLDQNKRSRVGAIGVMQIMPATGKELKVGDITRTEPNIHAGAKYMDQLMTRYFKDAKFDEQNRSLFAFASYNAGPGNISRMRKEAQKRGLDPDQWFNNVESRHGREDRDRDHDLRAQHLQVLRLLQAHAGSARRRRQAQGTGCAREEVTARRSTRRGDAIEFPSRVLGVRRSRRRSVARPDSPRFEGAGRRHRGAAWNPDRPARPGPRPVRRISFGDAHVRDGSTLFMAGMELDFGEIKGRPLWLGIAGWGISIVLGIAVVGIFHVIPAVDAPMMVTLALCTTGLGTLIPIFRDGGQLATKFGRPDDRGGNDWRGGPYRRECRCYCPNGTAHGRRWASSWCFWRSLASRLPSARVPKTSEGDRIPRP